MTTTKAQPFDFYLILDLEGKVEILEFPVTIINASTRQVVDRFHRYVHPVIMEKDFTTRYVNGKYGEWGLAEKWFESAIPFTQVLTEFEQFLLKHGLAFGKHEGHSWAFITCGDWDIKTQIPRQCAASNINYPNYFMSWVNVKDVYNNHYKPKNRVTGMKGLLGRLQIKLEGNHHSGEDDVHNITKVVTKMMENGIEFGVTRSHTHTSSHPNRESVLESIRNPPPKQPRKTQEKCVWFQRGACRYGDQCRYLHN